MNYTNIARETLINRFSGKTQQKFSKNQILKPDEVQLLIQDTRNILEDIKLRINQQENRSSF